MNPPQPTNPNAAPAAPMTASSIMAAIEANRQAMGTRSAAIPATISNYSPATDSTIANLQNNKADKIKQLFDHDTSLAQTYYQPQAAPGAHITDEATNPEQMIVDPMIGMKAAYGQDRATANEAVDIGTAIDKRKTELAANLAQAIALLQLQQTSSRDEQSSLETELGQTNTKNKTILDLLATTGGDISPELATALGDPKLAGTHVPGDLEKLRTQYSLTPAGKKESVINDIQADADSGMTLKDIVTKYKGKAKSAGVTGNDIVGAYDNSTKRGRHIENTAQLKAMGLNDYKPEAVLSSADEAKASNTYSTVYTIDNLKNTLATDTSLQKVIGNPASVKILTGLIEAHAGAVAQKMFGLSDKAMQAISEFQALQGQGDRDMVGGRLSGYLLNVFGKSFPSLDKSLGNNGALLDSLKERIIGSTDIYAKNNGFNSWQDIPGFENVTAPSKSGVTDSGVTHVQYNGKTYEFKNSDPNLQLALKKAGAKKL